MTSRPKLLFYTHALVTGGAERVWVELASAFARTGHAVVFVVKHDADGWRHLLDPAVPLIVLGRDGARPGEAKNAHLARVLLEERPAVALSAVGGSNLELVAARLRSRAPVEIVISYHGFAEWQTGKLSLATYLALPWLSRTTARTVAVSDGLRERLVRVWRSSPDRTVRIYNPVALPERIEAASNAADLMRREPLVLGVGRLVPDKAFDVLVDAFAQVKYPGARLVLLGEGSERARLEGEIAARGLTGRVSLAGHTLPWPWYLRARCLVSSSRTESFGNVLVEALAHGLPVVATRSGGPQEILLDGEIGTLVPVGDHAELARAIEQALQHPGDPTPRLARAAELSFDEGFAAYRRLVDELTAVQ